MESNGSTEYERRSSPSLAQLAAMAAAAATEEAGAADYGDSTPSYSAPASYSLAPEPVGAVVAVETFVPAPVEPVRPAAPSFVVEPPVPTQPPQASYSVAPEPSVAPASSAGSFAVAPDEPPTTQTTQGSGFSVAPSEAPVARPGSPGSGSAGMGIAPAATAAPVAVVSSPAALLADVEADETAYSRSTTEQGLTEDDLSLPDVLTQMLDAGASDCHLTTGARPTIRVRGELEPMENFPVLNPQVVQRVMYAIMTQAQREKFEEVLELDFSYALPGLARFRVNVYRQRDAIGAAFRVIPFEIKTLEQLGVPPIVSNFASLPRGFVLVTGPTGSGKSTTLAALVDLANRTRKDHIMTVEDPIEFLHRHKSCLVNQREVGEDTLSFNNALKHVLRQDPDIILVGELRDLETISVALTAAETGHLVFATLHTQDAAQTVDRIIDVFPPHQQQQIRQQLAGALQGVVCQTLCKTADGKGRVVATEVMVATPAIRNLIREGKTHQIYSSMQAGAKHGMHTLDQHLAELVRQRRITYEQGFEKCHHVEDFQRLSGKG